MKIHARFIQLLIFLLSIAVVSCASTKDVKNDEAEKEVLEDDIPIEQEISLEEEAAAKETLTLLFAGDIMAHNVNYQISSYSKIWQDVSDTIKGADLAFANIEAPIDTTKEASSYPNFNMTKNYVKAAINAGFSVFSLCNNHTNDQGLTGITETIKTAAALTKEFGEEGRALYFSGLKDGEESPLTYNIIDYEGWRILFLPITELLNRPSYSDYINFISPSEKSRTAFLQSVKKLKEENPCDIFVLSLHTSEPEYVRIITEKQRQFYLDLLSAGVDVLWANHAHIIKDREVVEDTKTGRQKIIMYANGNTISGQRPRPDFAAKTPDGERDNTGDGLFYTVTFSKTRNQSELSIIKARADFITTYINTAGEYVIKPLDESFAQYLTEAGRKDWAEYIKKRIKINKSATKDLITWQ